jgi:hypothetical protein
VHVHKHKYKGAHSISGRGRVLQLIKQLAEVANRKEVNVSSYIILEHKDLTVQVKFDDEGVVVDLFEKDEGEDVNVLATTWRLYDELPIKRR